MIYEKMGLLEVQKFVRSGASARMALPKKDQDEFEHYSLRHVRQNQRYLSFFKVPDVARENAGKLREILGDISAEVLDYLLIFGREMSVQYAADLCGLNSKDARVGTALSALRAEGVKKGAKARV